MKRHRKQKGSRQKPRYSNSNTHKKARKCFFSACSHNRICKIRRGFKAEPPGKPNGFRGFSTKKPPEFPGKMRVFAMCEHAFSIAISAKNSKRNLLEIGGNPAPSEIKNAKRASKNSGSSFITVLLLTLTIYLIFTEKNLFLNA